MDDRTAQRGTVLALITVALGALHTVASVGLSAVKSLPYTLRTAHLVWIGLFMVAGGVLHALALAHRDAQPLASRVARVTAAMLVAFAVTLLPVMVRERSPFILGPLYLLASNAWLLRRWASAATSRLASRPSAS
jgi:hypothetical protein